MRRMPLSSPFYHLINSAFLCPVDLGWRSWVDLAELLRPLHLVCFKFMSCFIFSLTHCKVNLLLCNWQFPKSHQVINLFTHLYSFIHSFIHPIHWVPPLCQALLALEIQILALKEFLFFWEQDISRWLQLDLCGTSGKHRILGTKESQNAGRGGSHL